MKQYYECDYKCTANHVLNADLFEEAAAACILRDMTQPNKDDPYFVVRLFLGWYIKDASGNVSLPSEVDDLPIVIYRGCPEKVNDTFDFPGLSLLRSRDKIWVHTILRVPKDYPVIYLTECKAFAAGTSIMYQLENRTDAKKYEYNMIPIIITGNCADITFFYDHDDINHNVPLYTIGHLSNAECKV